MKVIILVGTRGNHYKSFLNIWNICKVPQTTAAPEALGSLELTLDIILGRIYMYQPNVAKNNKKIIKSKWIRRAQMSLKLKVAIYGNDWNYTVQDFHILLHKIKFMKIHWIGLDCFTTFNFPSLDL